jgi:hypothetical protein
MWCRILHTVGTLTLVGLLFCLNLGLVHRRALYSILFNPFLVLMINNYSKNIIQTSYRGLSLKRAHLLRIFHNGCMGGQSMSKEQVSRLVSRAEGNGRHDGMDVSHKFIVQQLERVSKAT